jgi:Mg2+/Co2+ transporter CorC
LIRDLNEWLDLYLSAEEVDTIGGLVLSESKQVPEVGEEVQVDGTTFRVEALRGRAVAWISLEVTPAQAQRLKDLGL